MKKKINLLTKQKKYQTYETIFKAVKITCVLTIILFVTSYTVYYIILSSQKKELNLYLTQKKNALEYITQNKEVEAKFVYFSSKLQQISQILTEDVNFHPYYTVLTESLKSASPEGQLEKVSIDRNRTVDFSVNLADTPSLLSFLRFIESENFLENFDQLSLTNFTLYSGGGFSLQGGAGYKLFLKGVFKKLDETKS